MIAYKFLRDDATDIFDGLVIDVRLGPGGIRFVDAPEVRRITPADVTIAVALEDVLHPGPPGPPCWNGLVVPPAPPIWGLAHGKSARRWKPWLAGVP